MNAEIFAALRALEAERGIPMRFMLEKINKAIVTACKNSYGGNEDVIVKMDEDAGIFEVSLMKTVVETVENEGMEITLENARKIDPKAQLDEKVLINLKTKEFGRIAAQTARNIIRQGIKEGEKNLILEEFQGKHHEIVTAKVETIDSKTGAFTLRIGKAESNLPLTEQIGTEGIKEGDFVKVLVADVLEGGKGPKIMTSRSHPDFVKKLFESEVPEIKEGIIEIKAVAREAGARSKVAVRSNDPNIDPVGSCIGQKGMRINAVLNELGGERIDLINYSEDPEEFVIAALSPAPVVGIEFNSETPNQCTVKVPDTKLSLAIGARGQNVRLAARLTGMKIDIKPESGFYGES